MYRLRHGRLNGGVGYKSEAMRTYLHTRSVLRTLRNEMREVHGGSRHEGRGIMYPPTPPVPVNRLRESARDRAARHMRERMTIKLSPKRRDPARQARLTASRRESDRAHNTWERKVAYARKTGWTSHGTWHGSDDITYEAAHARARKLHAGETCQRCGARTVEMALITGRGTMFERGRPYSSNPADYIPLCQPHHLEYDGHPIVHGTRSRYRAGCRCEKCRASRRKVAVRSTRRAA